MISFMSPVGINVPRADGPAKVRGDAQYVDDIRPSDCLYGATVRSPIAHGRIIGLEKDPDFDWTDITVVTAEDIPAQNVVYLMTEDQPALADGLARHVEEPIALVAAPSRDLALDAVRHIKVVMEPLPALLVAQAAAHADSRRLENERLHPRRVREDVRGSPRADRRAAHRAWVVAASGNSNPTPQN